MIRMLKSYAICIPYSPLELVINLSSLIIFLYLVMSNLWINYCFSVQVLQHILQFVNCQSEK